MDFDNGKYYRQINDECFRDFDVKNWNCSEDLPSLKEGS